MKLYTLLLLVFCFSCLQAQRAHNIDFGKNTKVIIDNCLKNKTCNKEIQLKEGSLLGDFTGIDENDYIQIQDGSLIVKDTENAVCYLTQKLNMTETEKVRFEIDLSGTGTLDAYGELHDWVDVHYIIDDQKQHFGNEKYTLNGHVENIESDWIKTPINRFFQLELCMKTTGDDETYSINKIRIEEELKEVETSELTVFPNPSTDLLQIKNEHLFNLSKIELFNGSGTRLGFVSYPIRTSGFPAGNYFLRLSDKQGKVFSQSFVVVK